MNDGKKGSSEELLQMTCALIMSNLSNDVLSNQKKVEEGNSEEHRHAPATTVSNRKKLAPHLTRHDAVQLNAVHSKLLQLISSL